jgi:hypothetical protein
MSNHDNQNETIHASHLTGGALRVTFGAPVEEAPFVPGPQIRVHGGVTRFIAGQDEPTTEGVSRHVVSQDGHAGGSIAATLRRDGPNQTVELIPGTPASRTLLDIAIREGLVRRDSMGQLTDVQTGGQQRTLATAQAEQAAVVEAQQAAEQAAQEEAESGVWQAHEDEQFAVDMANVPEAAFRPALAAESTHWPWMAMSSSRPPRACRRTAWTRRPLRRLRRPPVPTCRTWPTARS